MKGAGDRCRSLFWQLVNGLKKLFFIVKFSINYIVKYMRKKMSPRRWGQCVLAILFLLSLSYFIAAKYDEMKDEKTLLEQTSQLDEITQKDAEKPNLPVAGVELVLQETFESHIEDESITEEIVPVMLPEYEALYEENNDCIGWLKIEDTVINYPVMQTLEDEQYYLRRDFYGNENKNGCLLLDTDTWAGVGTRETAYAGGSKPTTNLIIHGHTMKSGQMFGDLDLYADEEFGKEHNIICFDTLYEKREYELIAVFYSQVYYQSQNVFKYYNFFQADTQEEFDDWYNNIKGLSLYDTGVTAEFGDEFITLSCCAYHVEDGRFVVVGRRK